MKELIDFLSGNVPGGIFLYLMVIGVVFGILFFIYRVNELFTRRHLIRWLVICFTLLTILYASIWFKYPPDTVYKRYSVAVFESDTPGNWLGEYLTDLVSQQVQPYLDGKRFFVPYFWLYRIEPVDSVLGAEFRKRLFQGVPVRQVLEGELRRQPGGFEAAVVLKEYPSEKVIRQATGTFQLKQLGSFYRWLEKQFGNDFPLRSTATLRAFQSPDSLFILAKRAFFQRNYRRSQQILEELTRANDDPAYRRWLNYCRVKLIAEERLKSNKDNPFAPELPGWKKRLRRVRAALLQDLQSANQDSALSNLMVAESYLWEEEFGKAEIFLKKMLVDNPFNIDALLNLSFLHPSRYREFGFANAQEIYQRILTYWPLEEDVLIKWSEKILVGNPTFTAPPKKAESMLRRYLQINPYSYRIWLMLGQLYARAAMRNEALKSFVRADSLHPRSALIQYNLGVLFFEWEKYDQAEKYFRKAIELEDYKDAYLYLGAIYKERGDYRQALEYFRYRVAHKTGEDDFYAFQAMKGIQECLEALGEKPQ